MVYERVDVLTIELAEEFAVSGLFSYSEAKSNYIPKCDVLALFDAPELILQLVFD